MGIDNMVLVRDASPAMRPARFFSSGCAGTMPSTFFWFGQMMNQTLNHMMVPSHMPKPIAVLCGLWPPMPCSQRKAIVHQGKLTNSMVSPSAASGDGVDQQDEHNREHEAEHDRALQRVERIFHWSLRGRELAIVRLL